LFVTFGQPVTKYIVYARIDVDGPVDKPDVVGALFGQMCWCEVHHTG